MEQTILEKISKLQPEKGHYKCYQGWKKIGLKGQRPVEQRYEVYCLDQIINKNTTVLDLGCNVGCMTMHIAERAKEVHGVEYYSNFIKIANLIKQHLHINNCYFHDSSFYSFVHPYKFDVILSLAAHPNSTSGFRKLTEEVYTKMLKRNGHLLIESRNFGDGSLFGNLINHLESCGFIKKWQGICQCESSGGTDNERREYCIMRFEK